MYLYIESFGYTCKKIGGFGFEDGQFVHPLGIAIIEIYIYVVDSWNNRIQIFDHSGNFIKKWGIYGTDDGEFKIPSSIAIIDEEIHISDSNTFRIQVFDLDGHFIRKYQTHFEKDCSCYPINISAADNMIIATTMTESNLLLVNVFERKNSI